MFCDKSETEKNHDLIYTLYNISHNHYKKLHAHQQHPLWSPAQIIKVACVTMLIIDS